MKSTQELDIVCGIIYHKNKVLIARRGKGTHENIWEFPGGKVEYGETKEEAVVRELKEELELDVKVVTYITTIIDEREDVILRVHAYLCHLKKGTMVLHAHHEAKYVPVHELVKQDFEPADEPILKALTSLLDSRKWKAGLVVLLGIVAAFYLLYYLFIILVFLHFPTTHVWVQALFMGMVAFIGVYYFVLWYHVLLKTRLKRGLNKWVHITCLGFLLLGGLTLEGSLIYDRMQPVYETLSTEVDLEQYKPFESDKLARLTEPSTLKLQVPLPTLDGATAFYPVYAAFTEAVYPEKEYDLYGGSEVRCTTTPNAYENLINKQTDMIFVLGPSQEQRDMATRLGEEMVFTPIGKEAFVFFVNVENPVTSLTLTQVQEIYQGKITNWKQVGGSNEEIKAFQRPEGSGSQSALQRMMGTIPIMDPIEKNVVTGMGGILSQTADYENRESAIGYSFRYYSQSMVDNQKIRLLKIDGVEPNEENIRNGSYPLIDEVYAVTLASNQKQNVKDLMAWILSPQGQQLIETSGYVGI